jgi:hypothetical protein
MYSIIVHPLHVLDNRTSTLGNYIANTPTFLQNFRSEVAAIRSPPNGSVCAGTHAPYAFRCGKDEESAQHATVAMRIESYDANWGYFTQAGPPSAREP